jgi:hypothetical protein
MRNLLSGLENPYTRLQRIKNIHRDGVSSSADILFYDLLLASLLRLGIVSKLHLLSP